MLADRDEAARRTTEQLQRLIRFKTVNPPGNELPLALHLHALFAEHGIHSEIVQTAPNRAAVIARLTGTGARRPMMLLAHTDVVGVESENWSVDPFAGEIRDGFVYGRGAIDDKGMLASNIVTMLALNDAVATGEIVLDRDVVFLAAPDEESSGDSGMAWLVANHPTLFDVEYALNEGGRVRILADGSRKLLIQYAEKTSHMVTITASGTAGHSGVPRTDNAILRLARSLAAIDEYAADARNGVSPTILRAGEKSNVIPAEASAVVNIRTLPGSSIDDIVAEITRLIADPLVAVVVAERGRDAPASSMQSPLYDAIGAAARELDPSISVEPYLSAGVTDSAWLRRLGIAAYGVLPFPLTADDEARMHGADERVGIDALGFGTLLVLGAVRRLAEQPR